MADLFDSISSDSQSSKVDILKELLNPEDIEIKSDLNMSQVKVLVQLKWFAKVLDPENSEKSIEKLLEETMAYYMTIKCSVGRKSRSEVIEALKQMQDDLQDQAILPQMRKRS